MGKHNSKNKTFIAYIISFAILTQMQILFAVILHWINNVVALRNIIALNIKINGVTSFNAFKQTDTWPLYILLSTAAATAAAT